MRRDVRQHTSNAVDTLAQILDDPAASASARIAAATALLDRGWGRPGPGERVQSDDPFAGVSDAQIAEMIDFIQRELEARG